MENLEIEIATVGYDRGNPLCGYAAYCLWIDGKQVSERAFVVTNIPRGSNSMGIAYVQGQGIEDAWSQTTGKNYSVTLYGSGIIKPGQVLRHGKPASFSKYFHPSFLYIDFLEKALAVRDISIHGEVPNYVLRFREKHQDWISSGNPKNCPIYVMETFFY